MNYHRTGDAAETPYDPNVFSATAEEFDRHIAYYKRRFHIAGLPEALELVNGPAPRGTVLLITFDDGYIDCYTQAFPILRSHGVPATFFLPTAFVGTGIVPWWDEIAYIIKSGRNRCFQIQYPSPASFDLDADGHAETTRKVLNLFKLPETTDAARFIVELESACRSARPHGNAARCFLNWDEAREMQQNGMFFGSHTHTHEVLSKIPRASQQEEFRVSRQILEREMRSTIDTLAYPVGQPNCFSSDTYAALERTGYRAAFSYYGGINHPGKIQPFDIKRFGVGDQSYTRLRLQTALGSTTGSRWI